MVYSAAELAELMPDASLLESDEPEMESSLHATQLMLLVACLEFLWQQRSDYFIGSNLTVYYSLAQLKSRDFRGPDFFLVKNTVKRHRRSWVVWEEDGKYPDLIIELLSESTARVDRNLKKTLYQDSFRTPEYFWFSPDTLEFMGYRLMHGDYLEISPNEQGRRWSAVLELYLGVHEQQLRYFSAGGELIPTPAEAARLAQQEQDLAQQERDVANHERDLAQRERDVAVNRAETLAQRLREMGIEP
jgi:Uma2 family endonuclease